MTLVRGLRAISLLLIGAILLAGCVQQNQPNVVINAGCVGCNVNAGGARPAPSPFDLAVHIPTKPGEQNRYLWGQRSYIGSAALFQVVQAESEAALAKIQPSTAAPLGSLRIILPIWTPKKQQSTTNPAGADDAMRTEVEYWRIINEVRLKALERRKAFSSIVVERKNVSIPEIGQADFTIWHDSSTWRVRYKENAPSFSSNTADVKVWLDTIEARAKENKNKKEDGLGLTVIKRGSQSHLQYLGKDYFSAEALRAAMEPEVLAQGRATPVISDRLGGRVKVILTDFTLMQKNGETSALVLEGWQLHGKLVSKGRVEGLIASKLFDKVDVEMSNLTDAPLNGYDVVLWQPALDPWKWRYRIASSPDAFSFTPPPGSPYTSFASALGEEIRRNKR